jgi:hypothetical protein
MGTVAVLGDAVIPLRGGARHQHCSQRRDDAAASIQIVQASRTDGLRDVLDPKLRGVRGRES